MTFIPGNNDKLCLCAFLHHNILHIAHTKQNVAVMGMKRNVIVTQHYTSTIVDIKWWLFGNISLIYCFFFVPDKILPRLLYWGNSITDRRSIRKDKNVVLFVLSVSFSNNIASSTSDMFLWACIFSRTVYVRKCFIVDTGHHFINTVQLSNETGIFWPVECDLQKIPGLSTAA